MFGDISGLVHVVSRQHKVNLDKKNPSSCYQTNNWPFFQAYSFSAYNVAVTHCCANSNRPSGNAAATPPSGKLFLVTIGTDSDDLVPVLKIWRINESALTPNNEENLFQDAGMSAESTPPGEQNSTPIGSCIRTIKLCQTTPQLNTLRPHVMVTVLDVLHDTIIAIGFNDGRCLIIRGDLIRDTRNIKMRLLEVSANESSITGVAFSSYFRTYKTTGKTFRTFNAATSGTRQHVILFVSTRNEICSFDLSNRESKEPKIVLGWLSILYFYSCT